MTVETRNRDAEKLVRGQREAVSSFFGAEVPVPTDRLFVVCENIRRENLWTPEPFFVPLRRLPEGVSFPGLKHPLSSVLYGWIREGYVDADADTLPGQWIIWDSTRRPKYDNEKQMYPDTSRLREILASLRERQDGIKVPDNLRHVSQDSRFGISPDEIDGSKNLVAGELAGILGLQEGEIISTPSCAAFNYIGNLAHPELGEVDTSEWLRNKFERGDRLRGGDSGFGGLSSVNDWLSGGRGGSVGFRLQVSFPSIA